MAGLLDLPQKKLLDDAIQEVSKVLSKKADQAKELAKDAEK
jgi:hypothetical protein